MPDNNNRCGYTAIVGRPNVGKSTLMNRIIGLKLAITSHKAQTTRHSILGIKTLDGGQVVYVDTPGIHERADHAMNRYLNRTAKSALTDVDVIIFVVEALRWTSEDSKVLKILQECSMPVILAINKVDTIKKKEELLPYLAEMAERYAFAEVIPISAKNGSNVETLESRVLKKLPPGDNFFPEDQLTDRPEKFFAAEMVREQITRRYAKELPYAVSVEIERFEEDNGLYRISAVVWVEKPGQKAIIIGKNGAALKSAATQARKAMESFFDCKVYLEVWVKVKRSWSSDESALVRLGYGD
ncbi:GTPase Era [endosymbiont of Lamellibrachia barhami]|uniref:GTPase Era n=1 Tax=endosymbiont of Lamellibrachia barhami TaxID=205975 RepID=UPI0015B068C2|nr:GTPase Era [endosymbiont of Lamellibrachia barhami]